MNLHYQNSKLHFGVSETDLTSLVKNYEGPVYVYDLKGIEKRYKSWQQALGEGVSVHYAVKANSNQQVLKKLKSLGAHADVVSGGEIKAALAAGFEPQDIIFSGVGKTVEELTYALDLGIYQINVESPSELRRIAQIAEQKKIKAPIAVRYNPDVNPVTHPYITTGFRENKFGIEQGLLPEIVTLLQNHSTNLELKGFTLHIGSQILDIEVYQEAIQKTKVIFHEFKAMGFELQRFDIGGGLGIHYERADLEAEEVLVRKLGAMVQAELGDLGIEIQTEPGRWIVAHSGVLISQVQYVKSTSYKNFIILDSGMHHLIRPALYGAYHGLWPLCQREGALQVYDIVGPICESSDYFAKNRELTPVQEDDFVVIADAGAYGFSMASLYNAHHLPQEICIE